MNLTQKLRRINRKYRQFVNYGVTAFIIFALGILFIVYQQRVAEAEAKRQDTAYAALETALNARQDSILVEVDRMKIGIDEATTRRFKIIRSSEIIRAVQKDMGESDALNLATLFYDEAERNGIDLSYVLAVAYTESRFNHKVTSDAGAQGIMQIMPLTFLGLAKMHDYDYLETDIGDVKKNIRIGTIYLHRLLSMYGTFDLASAGYNGGPKVECNYQKMMAGDTTVFVPEETKKYVTAVRSKRLHYKQILGE